MHFNALKQLYGLMLFIKNHTSCVNYRIWCLRNHHGRVGFSNILIGQNHQFFGGNLHFTFAIKSLARYFYIIHQRYLLAIARHITAQAFNARIRFIDRVLRKAWPLQHRAVIIRIMHHLGRRQHEAQLAC